ncbi:MAG: hypothetical protein GKS00_24055 [Alphaproteobacteria bacterium]|nr:hypothetical protein [Alphaproteobacteria bacterium]
MRHLKAALALLPFLFAANAAAPASAAEVVVVRGNVSEAVTINRSGPTVLRGGGTMRVKPPSETKVVGPVRVVAGRTLWVVDEYGRPKTACFVVRTAYVGKRKIRCTDYRY